MERRCLSLREKKKREREKKIKAEAIRQNDPCFAQDCLACHSG